MRTILIILLLILVPFQGIIYSMPVPSETVDKSDVAVHGGGTTGVEALGILAGIFYICLGCVVVGGYAGYYYRHDDNESNDYLSWLGYTIAIVGASGVITLLVL